MFLIYSRKLFISSFRTSVIFIKNVSLWSLSCAAAMLQFSGPTEVGLLGSSGDRVSWLLFCVCVIYAGFWASVFGMVVIRGAYF